MKKVYSIIHCSMHQLSYSVEFVDLYCLCYSLSLCFVDNKLLTRLLLIDTSTLYSLIRWVKVNKLLGKSIEMLQMNRFLSSLTKKHRSFLSGVEI